MNLSTHRTTSSTVRPSVMSLFRSLPHRTAEPFLLTISSGAMTTSLSSTLRSSVSFDAMSGLSGSSNALNHFDYTCQHRRACRHALIEDTHKGFSDRHLAWALNRSEARATEGFHRRNLRRFASLTEEAAGSSSALRAGRSSSGVGEDMDSGSAACQFGSEPQRTKILSLVRVSVENFKKREVVTRNRHQRDDAHTSTLSGFKNGRRLGVMKHGLGGEYRWFVAVLSACTVSMSKGRAPMNSIGKCT